MAPIDDETAEDLVDELRELRGGRSPNATPAIGIIVVILILIGAGYFTTQTGQKEEPTRVVGACKVSGCNSELCVSAGESISSTCQYKEEYSCYQSASCEVQPSGECGWTPTDKLNQCISTARGN